MAQNRNNKTPGMLAMGNRILTLRKEHSESQIQLAKAIGVGSAIISMWERGDRGPSKDNLEKLAQHFGVTSEYLQHGDDEPTIAATVSTPEPEGTVLVGIDSALYERIQKAATAQGTDAADWIAETIQRPLELFEIQQRHATQNSDFETYTVEEVAALLDVTDRTVKMLIHDGQLSARKIGRRWRVTPDNLKAYINGEVGKA